MSETLRVSSNLISTAAGAPLLPKLVTTAKGSIALGVGLMVLLVLGYFMGGSDSAVKSVTGFGTAMRNVSAALVVATLNFDATVVSYMIVMLLISLVILMPAARELGKRMGKAANGEKSASQA